MSTIKSSAENLTLNADGANNDVIIQSNGSTKVTLDGQNGRVGIGTTAPDKELHTVNASQSVANRVAYNGTYYTDYGYYQVNTQQNDFVLKTTGTTRFTVKNDTGYLIAATGVTFGTDTAAANALSDYEEGSWTPVMTGSSSAGSYSYDASRTNGRYTKIGNQVILRFSIRVTGTSSAGSGNARIAGLPFVPTTTGVYPRYPGSLLGQSTSTNAAYIICAVEAASAYVALYNQSTTSIDDLPVTDADHHDSIYAGQITYETNS